MKTTINLTNYFKRIGYDGSAAATLDTLQKLHLLHTQTIPFENLNPLLGLPVKLDLESLQQKLVDNRRGGYCFEHNLFFCDVLKTIGFEAESFAGRVIWNQPEDKITSLTHAVLIVTIGGQKYHVDVGFGGQSPTAPLLFEPGLEQETPHESYRLIKREAGYYLLQTKVKGEWKHMYRYTLQQRFPVDYKVNNWYTSTHPDSHFTKGLTAARAGDDCRYVLSNNKFKVHYLDRETEEHLLESADEIKQVLEDEIGLKLPEVDNLESTLKNFIE